MPSRADEARKAANLEDVILIQVENRRPAACDNTGR
jgi:hypothetical protein